MIILHTFVRHNVDNIAMNMDLSLSNFEQQIDGTILKRGFDYFKKGYVTEVEDLGGGDFEATVEGSEIYTVHSNIIYVVSYKCM